MTQNTAPHIVMCKPQHFEVSYTINPWMHPDEWAENSVALALESNTGWEALYAKFQQMGVRLDLVPPQPGLPDLVFTANAALVLNRTALVASFRYKERQGEEPHYLKFFEELRDRGDLDVVEPMPKGVLLEGAGDCVWDQQRRLFWMGYGQRSEEKAAAVVQSFFGLETIALELVNPRYYHMDTALVPLSGGEITWFPGAFSPAGQAIIRERAGAGNLIDVPEEDAARLGVNAVNLGKDIILAKATDTYKIMLAERGYTLHQLPISSFSKSGGSAFCLTLRVDRMSN